MRPSSCEWMKWIWLFFPGSKPKKLLLYISAKISLEWRNFGKHTLQVIQRKLRKSGNLNCWTVEVCTLNKEEDNKWIYIFQMSLHVFYVHEKFPIYLTELDIMSLYCVHHIFQNDNGPGKKINELKKENQQRVGLHIPGPDSKWGGGDPVCSQQLKKSQKHPILHHKTLDQDKVNI